MRKEHTFTQNDFEHFYRVYKKRQNIEQAYSDRINKDPHVKVFKHDRKMHENPDQVHAKNYFDRQEEMAKKANLYQMLTIGGFLGFLVAILFAAVKD